MARRSDGSPRRSNRQPQLLGSWCGLIPLDCPGSWLPVYHLEPGDKIACPVCGRPVYLGPAGTRLDLDTSVTGPETKVEAYSCTATAAELWTMQGSSHAPAFA